MSELRWAVQLLKPYWRQFSLSVFLALATVASGLGLLATSAYLIAAAALQPSIAELQVAIVGVRSLGLARGLLRYAERYLSHNVTFMLLGQIRVWVYRKLEPLAPAVLADDRSGDLLARLVDDVETMQFLYLRGLQPPLVAASGICILLAIVIPIDFTLAIVWAGLLLIAGLVIPLLANTLSRAIQNQLLEHRGHLKQEMVELVQGLPEWIAFDASQSQAAKIEQIGQQFDLLHQRLASVQDINQAGLVWISQLAPLATLWLLLPLLQNGQLNGVGLAVLVVASLASFELVTPLVSALPAMESGIAASRRLLELAHREPVVATPSQTASASSLEKASLSIRGLNFSYKASRLPALKGIDLNVSAGERLALVGPSGAGKSTLFNLLLRFWDYQTGTIQLGGVELGSFDPEAARSLFGVLTARTMLFHGSLRENLQLAKPEATQDEMIRALELAGVAQLLKLPSAGLEIEIGEWGLQLSAGQRQRLALARTLLQDRPYLLLDEPTANLDPAAAGLILADLLQATRGKTTLLITHQLLGLEMVDRIAVLQGGRIVQQGSHDQLIHQAGLYKTLWDLQVERWRIEQDLGLIAE
jgi:ATP-binding cassette subfamily C protein CydC